jgi:hypothetical protein
MKRTARSVVLVLAVPLLVAAQTALTGKWRGETPDGGQIVLDVKATDATLTGTFTMNTETAAITDGRVSKNTFTFRATIDDRGDDGFSGEVGTDQVRLWPDRMGPDRAVVLRREK